MRKLGIVAAVVVILAGAAGIGWGGFLGPAPAGGGGRGPARAARKGERGPLLIFTPTQCPYSNAYNPRMEALHRDYSARGVRVVGINPNKTEPAEEVRSHEIGRAHV